MSAIARVFRANPWTRLGRSARREALTCYLFIAPWAIGFLLWQLGPMLFSLFLSFTRYNAAHPPQWLGLQNYQEMFRQELFWKTLRVTSTYTVLAVPLRVFFALIVASLLFQPIPLRSMWRTIYYLPAITSGVAVALLWSWIFQPQYGLFNTLLWQLFRIKGPLWFFSTDWAIPALVIMNLWGVGGPMLIYLAGMQGVPTELYEAAELDGANGIQRYARVTIPMITPVIFFNLIMSMIGSFQVFTTSYVITQGGPHYATFFIVLYLYFSAFQDFRLGYASALAWVLFIVIVTFTILLFRSSRSWVYYGGQGGQ